MSMSLLKQEIRDKITAFFKTYEIDKIDKSSVAISLNLLKFIENINVCQILSYYPMRFEVQIQELLNSLLKLNFEVFLPKILDRYNMNFFKYFGTSSLKIGKFNLLEPISCVEFNSDKYSVVLVPGLAFSSKTGHRVGRGGGFYDIFLQRGLFLKVGVCFDFQIFNFVPFCSNDIKLDVMISEEKVFYFCE
ncbi:5-formyltetrahydrofolate cyclo-ligase [Borrelia turcica IST7]|uniref:5-formyltetrahydrofolate cyclo-ligase n=1 Tax=Borrelia turcica IST7 TaxID=1104446 RepID=A0A386PKC9_9SPIR|nr:5-formyltetrahydrofolate cyclo-ligase [Borrelia turcica]AYE36201.1 5-formyltetrahydrofolate cyclo-ligase [Borrelia turcica IST7]